MICASVADVLALLGDEALQAGRGEARHRFLGYLRQPKWRPSNFHSWLDECLEVGRRGLPAYYHALQDIVVTVGLHLGMQVEYGSYSPCAGLASWDGRWLTTSGKTILVEVKSSAWPASSARQLGSYLDATATTTADCQARATGLYVIGRGSAESLIDQIKGGEYRGRLKVITCRDLIRLWELRDELEPTLGSARSLAMVQSLLLPFESVNVGALLDVIHGLAAAGPGPDAALPTSPTASPAPSSLTRWGREELWEFLESCRPEQVGLLAALSSTAEEGVAATHIVAWMQHGSGLLESGLADLRMDAKAIASARGALARRARLAGREGFIEVSAGRYRIKGPYLGWVRHWLTVKGHLNQTSSAGERAEPFRRPGIEELIGPRLMAPVAAALAGKG
jgi:hypothetical protein